MRGTAEVSADLAPRRCRSAAGRRGGPPSPPTAAAAAPPTPRQSGACRRGVRGWVWVGGRWSVGGAGRAGRCEWRCRSIVNQQHAAAAPGLRTLACTSLRPSLPPPHSLPPSSPLPPSFLPTPSLPLAAAPVCRLLCPAARHQRGQRGRAVRQRGRARAVLHDLLRHLEHVLPPPRLLPGHQLPGCSREGREGRSSKATGLVRATRPVPPPSALVLASPPPALPRPSLATLTQHSKCKGVNSR